VTRNKNNAACRYSGAFIDREDFAYMRFVKKEKTYSEVSNCVFDKP
jgi:hypothetical protein